MLTEYIAPRNMMFDFRRRMDQFLSGLAQEAETVWPFNSLSGSLPASNIWENKEAYFVELAAPGIKEDNISLSMIGNELTIQLERPSCEETEKVGKFWRQERVNESSSMSISLPGVIDSKDITADLKNGILVIRVPKSEETQTKKICVNASKCKKD
ncbi:MAG: Hsp20/alpha crystallin family protein [Planctomycetia bacterium]|nr:Hsp20/alpha crystallin family protein [Planctomycetia bacterium]